jgi:protein TonB
VELSLVSPPPKAAKPNSRPSTKLPELTTKPPVEPLPTAERDSAKPERPTLELPPNPAPEFITSQQPVTTRADRVVDNLPAEARSTASASRQTPPSTIDVERAYELELKTLIEAKKTYPSNRQASIERPEGAVEVCLSLNRNGERLSSEIVSRSGSIILDRSALSLVSSLNYPAFPSDAFRQETQRRFCVVLEYRRK